MNFMPVNRPGDSQRLRQAIRRSLAQSEKASLAQLRASSKVQPPLTEQELQALARALAPRLRQIQKLHFSS